MSAVGLAQLRIFEEEGADPGRVVIGHADSYPVLDHYLAIVERGANLEFDFLGMPLADRAHGERRGRSSCCCELLARGHADRILLSQDVCHDTQLQRYGGNGYTYLAGHVPAPTPRRPASATRRSRRSRSRTRGGC